MSEDDEATEAAIDQYRGELQAEAELARGDLEEIEDHMRQLIDQLRAAGAADVIGEARRRLGDPRSVAREHARVRGAFGARLSRARAWSAAALFVTMAVANFALYQTRAGSLGRYVVELGLAGIVTLGLVARLSWARPVVLGALGFVTVPAMVQLAWGVNPIWFVGQLGVLAFVAPWRRRELSAAGAGLALNVAGYMAASFALSYQLSTRDGSFDLVPAQIAAFAAVIAVTGGILRARWSAIASAVSAVTLFLSVSELWSLRYRFPHADLYRVEIIGLVLVGAVASAAGALVAWKTARSNLGTLRSIAS